MTSAPVTLEIKAHGEYGGNRKREHLQLSVTQEVIGGLSKTREEAASVLVCGCVEPRYRFDVQELMEEPATFSPFAAVTVPGKTPRVGIHTKTGGQR